MNRHSFFVGLLLATSASLVAAGVAQAQSATPSPTVTPAPSPTPTPTATTSIGAVQVQDLAVVESADLVEPGGRIKHPSEVTSTVTLSWSAGTFIGSFQVERATRTSKGGDLGPYELIGTQANVSPALSFSESMPLLSRPLQSCYRVRAVAAGAVGPYSNVACTVIPPSTGPGVDLESPTPLPPPTGSDYSSGASSGSWAVLAMGLAAFIVGLGAIAARGRRN